MITPICYRCDGPADPTIIGAFVVGSGGVVEHIACAPYYRTSRPAVVWGLLRGTWGAMCDWRMHRRPFVYIDHGYFRRGHFDGYYRCVWNGFQHNVVLPPDEARWRALGLETSPWRKGGAHIVVCPPSNVVANLFGQERWLDGALYWLKQNTDREIRVRRKRDASEKPLSADLEGAHALVTYSSIAAVEAVAAGVPVFVDETSAAAPVASGPLTAIENPSYPDRDAWLAGLAAGQFTLAEMRDGTAWRILIERIPTAGSTPALQQRSNVSDGELSGVS